MGHTKFGAFPETVGIVKFLQRGQTDFSLGNSDNLLKCFVPLCSWKTTHRDDASVIFLLSSDIRIQFEVDVVGVFVFVITLRK